MPRILRQPVVRINVLGVKDVQRFLGRLEKKDWTRIRKAAGRALVSAWRESIKRSRIRQRTGALSKTAHFRSVSKFAVEMYVIAYYAPYLYYGTKPSRGRYVPYMPCIGRGARLVRPIRRRKIKVRSFAKFMQMYEAGRVVSIRPGAYAKLRKFGELRGRGRPPVVLTVEYYDIGMHPGVDAKRLGLRRWFEYLYPIYVTADVIKTVQKITGVKIV